MARVQAEVLRKVEPAPEPWLERLSAVDLRVVDHPLDLHRCDDRKIIFFPGGQGMFFPHDRRDFLGRAGPDDRLGHVVGDQILRHFGRILLSETRAMNLAARYGGDEFISILTELPREGAELHAHRVVSRVREDPELSRYGVTVSYGIGEFDPATMFEVEDLVRAADAQLYQAKTDRRQDP